MEDKDNQERLKTTISNYLNSDYWQSFEELESTSEWEEFIEELAMDIQRQHGVLSPSPTATMITKAKDMLGLKGFGFYNFFPVLASIRAL